MAIEIYKFHFSKIVCIWEHLVRISNSDDHNRKLNRYTPVRAITIITTNSGGSSNVRMPYTLESTIICTTVGFPVLMLCGANSSCSILFNFVLFLLRFIRNLLCKTFNSGPVNSIINWQCLLCVCMLRAHIFVNKWLNMPFTDDHLLKNSNKKTESVTATWCRCCYYFYCWCGCCCWFWWWWKETQQKTANVTKYWNKKFWKKCMKSCYNCSAYTVFKFHHPAHTHTWLTWLHTYTPTHTCAHTHTHHT